jgi:hypothetical protein
MIDFNNTFSSTGTMNTEDVLKIERYSKTQICGVYFLVKNEEVIYVGKSIDLLTRVVSHVKTKDFDSFALIQCDEHMLDFEETKYILHYRPIQNKSVGDYEYIGLFGWYSRCKLIYELKLNDNQIPELDRHLRIISETINCFRYKLYKVDDVQALKMKLFK